MTWLKNLTVGEEVFLVRSSRQGVNRYVEVEKVGRKWATLSGQAGRVDITQKLHNDAALVDHTYGSPDRIYRSQEVYEKRIDALKLRKTVCDAVSMGSDLTDEKIKEIAAVLGIINNQRGEQ